jgi:hypothetical protein
MPCAAIWLRDRAGVASFVAGANGPPSVTTWTPNRASVFHAAAAGDRSTRR